MQGCNFEGVCLGSIGKVFGSVFFWVLGVNEPILLYACFITCSGVVITGGCYLFRGLVLNSRVLKSEDEVKDN